jgi:hypothetical protein
MAIELVSGAAAGTSGDAMGAGGIAAPQLEQNWLLLATSAPHLGQNNLHPRRDLRYAYLNWTKQ